MSKLSRLRRREKAFKAEGSGVGLRDQGETKNKGRESSTLECLGTGEWQDMG